MTPIEPPNSAASRTGERASAVRLVHDRRRNAQDVGAHERAAPPGGERRCRRGRARRRWRRAACCRPGSRTPRCCRCPAQAKNTTSSTRWTMPPASELRPTPVTASAGRDARLLHVADVERHPADVGRRDPVDERRRQLRLDGGHERQRLGDAADHADRGGDVGQHRHHDGDGEPPPVGRPQRRRSCRRRWPAAGAARRRRRSARRS